ncbi:MarR family winged helix-turn-helix transcriptional regulator [Nocardioides sp.]|uniref:MarR family winged helix-turn-helix transcriptional regulator n=1 Tax=Nocardioides sp. TaxID=35761 RepID=UPI00351543CA
MSRTKLAGDAWGSVLRAHALLVPRMDRELQAQTGLPLRWFDVLLELDAAPEGRLTMTQLADRVVLSRTRVSRVVDELAGAGLVARETNAQDRRSAFAVLTPAGRAAFVGAAPVYRGLIRGLFAGDLDDAELTTIRDALGRVVDGAADPSPRA